MLTCTCSGQRRGFQRFERLPSLAPRCYAIGHISAPWSHLSDALVLQYNEDLAKDESERMFAAKPWADVDGKLQAIVISTPEMAADARRYGHDAAWVMDSTFGTNQYGFSLFTCSVADEGGHGRQTGFILCRLENHTILARALQSLVAHIRKGGSFYPSATMADCCKVIRAAVDTVLPSSQHLWCTGSRISCIGRLTSICCGQPSRD